MNRATECDNNDWVEEMDSSPLKMSFQCVFCLLAFVLYLTHNLCALSSETVALKFIQYIFAKSLAESVNLREPSIKLLYWVAQLFHWTDDDMKRYKALQSSLWADFCMFYSPHLFSIENNRWHYTFYTVINALHLNHRTFER